jgi:hypothetical protein
MLSCNYTKPSVFLKVIRNFLFNKAFSFFAALLLVIIAGMFFPKPCLAQESAVKEEYEAQKKLMQLQSAVDDEDYMKAQFIMSSFKRDFSDANFYKMYSKRIDELTRKVEKKAKDIKVEDKIEYLFVPPRLKTKLWEEYMSKAERIVSQRQGKIGVAVLRVIFEDEDIEHPSVGVDRNSNNELNILHAYDGGYSCMGTFQSGEAVFVGSEFRRCGDSDSNNKDVSAIGNIIIGGIYHYPVKLKIEVQKGKAVAFGEVIVRSIPKKYCGNLMVKVETEEGLNLTDAAVNLKVPGFYPGITMPLKDGSCLFSSIGPGGYTVELAKNNALGSSAQSADVVLGQTTEVTINAYRHRMLELDWRFRKSNEPNSWLSGRRTMRTKEYWQPDEEWTDVHYPVVELGDWVDNTCKIRSYNGNLMCIDTNEPFEQMSFPLNFSSSSRDYPVKEGDVFAWRKEDYKQKGSFSEALIRIRKITPVGIIDDQKSSVQEKSPVLSELAGEPNKNVGDKGK